MMKPSRSLEEMRAAAEAILAGQGFKKNDNGDFEKPGRVAVITDVPGLTRAARDRLLGVSLGSDEIYDDVEIHYFDARDYKSLKDCQCR